MTYLARQLNSVPSDPSFSGVPFSPDGRWAATSGRVFEAATGVQRCALLAPSGWGAAVFSPAGDRVVVSSWQGPTAVMFDAVTGVECWRAAIDQTAFDVGWSPDGQRVGVGSPVAVQVLDAATG